MTEMILSLKRNDALAVGSVSIAETAICIALITPLKSQKPPDSTNLTMTSARDAAYVQKNALATIFK